jgi:hypothetical protein
MLKLRHVSALKGHYQVVTTTFNLYSLIISTRLRCSTLFLLSQEHGAEPCRTVESDPHTLALSPLYRLSEGYRRRLCREVKLQEREPQG